jgi:uncharacterized repeat protein (TIGR03847 family)
MIELDPVDRITTDAVGEPGRRTFFIQARKGEQLVTLLVEKQQVQLLAASVLEILSRVAMETPEGPPDDQMGLEEPIVPEWRAGRISIGYQEERDLVMIEAEELLPEADDAEEGAGEGEPEEPSGLTAPTFETFPPELGVELTIEEVEEAAEAEEPEEPLEGEPADEREPERVRFWATRGQMLSLARHGAQVCAAGRPLCQLCDQPLDPEGHVCPNLNGHRKLGQE